MLNFKFAPGGRDTLLTGRFLVRRGRYSQVGFDAYCVMLRSHLSAIRPLSWRAAFHVGAHSLHFSAHGLHFNH